MKTLKQKNTHPQFNNKPQPHDINKKLKQRNQGKSSLCESTVRIRVNSYAKLKRQSKRHRKGTVKTRRIAYAARIHVKTQPFCKPGKKALEKHNIFCNWRIAEKLCKIQGPCPCQNGRQLPSNLWMRRGDVTRSKNSKNELDIYIYDIYLRIFKYLYIQCMLLHSFFYIKCVHLTGNLPSGTGIMSDDMLPATCLLQVGM